MFAMDNVVVIYHPLGHTLRVHPDKQTHVDHEGGTGEFAHWKAILHDHGKKIQLQSTKTNKYLRLHDDRVDAEGVGGDYTYFLVHRISNGYAKLESEKHNGKYIAVDKHGVRVGDGGPFCRLGFFREGKAESFSKPYHFKEKTHVVIEHPLGEHLRVADEHSTKLDGSGQKGKLAQWEADPEHGHIRFKNVQTGKYLRIHDGKIDVDGEGGPFTQFKVHVVYEPNQVKLESVKHAGSYIAVDKNGVRVGQGGPWCEMIIYRD
jgi:hypothetical protein